MGSLSSCCIAILLASFALAQFPPQPEGITTKEVQSIPGASISYKETFVCEISARAWAGYVHLPASALTDIETSEPYNLSMFFWYFEAREDPRNAPTAIYLAGGPGEPGVGGALSSGGPCTVNRDGKNPLGYNALCNLRKDATTAATSSAVWRLTPIVLPGALFCNAHTFANIIPNHF